MSRARPVTFFTMARPRDQDRRRKQLVRATNELVARKGMASVRLRDVAEHAGLTPGAVLYYYEGLDELFFAAYEGGIHRYCEDREEAIAAIDRPVAKLATALRLGIPSGPADIESRLLYEFEAVAFRSEACAQLMKDYVDRQVEMYVGILRDGARAGEFAIEGDVRAASRVIVAMEDGHGPYVLTGQVTPAEAERLFMQHGAALTGVPLRRLAASGRRLRALRPVANLRGPSGL
jgi:AcrR family transcriptional regulator